jgi:hypothetical protein
MAREITSSSQEVIEILNDDDNDLVPLKCPRGHILVQRSLRAYLRTLQGKKGATDSLVSCDECGQDVLEMDDILSQCTRCVYDVCGKCTRGVSRRQECNSNTTAAGSEFFPLVHDKVVLADIKALEPDLGPTYIIEKAKSGRAECQKCSQKIEKDIVRVGVITEGEWGLFTKWQHCKCTIFHKSIEFAELLDGFHELDSSSKQEVRSRVEQSKTMIDADYIPVR